MPTVLAIESATVHQSVALVRDEAVLGEERHEEAGSHARWLVPAIDRLLARCKMDLSALDAYVVSQGPGSFTGLRVGLATALGFRAVTRIPIVTVGTLEAMAWGLREVLGPICPIVPCRAGEVFWAQYEWTAEGRFGRLCEPRVGPPSAVAATLTLPTAVLGAGWLASSEQIVAGDPSAEGRANRWRSVDQAHFHPSAATVGRLGLLRLREGRIASETIAPLYVQRSEAELKHGLVEGKTAKILRGAGKASAPRRRVSRTTASRIS
ncbi:MAG: tRNA (adenosine(37)-N6)-threonylcarbamoyltransferase complex dimerization subunit type 1 TsaB [Nitrospiraceae bacterium]